MQRMIRTCHKVIFGQVSVLVQDMGKKKKEKRGALAGCARICKIFGTVCLVAVILVCLPLTLPRVFGYEIYTVISGSMEPAIPVGSLVYVQPGAPEDAGTDDVIAFYSSMDTGAIITHRVIKNDIVTGQIHTKGDANEKEDLYPVGYDYYIGRALSAATINHFGLGFAPNQWDALLKHMRAKGYQPAELVDAGLARKGQKGYYDNFRNRVMTPIIDVRGNVIAFGGRVLDDSKPKYINTGDTLVYKKTNELFALNFAKDSKEDALILCEGYMDVIAMHQAGFTNAVAGCGTALTTEQVRLISRYAKEVILTYDADEAGQKALQKAMTLFDQTDVKVRIPALVGGKDPDEIIRTYGRDKFKGMLEGASNETEFRLLALRRQYNLATTQGKIDFIGGALQILATVPPVEQDVDVSRLSEGLGVERQNMKVQLQDLVARQGNRRGKREFKRIVQENMRKTARETMATDASLRKLRAEDRLISLLLRYPDCSRLCKDFDPQWLTPGFAQRVFTLILQRLENGDGTELMDLRDRLTDDEMGRLSGIIARGGESADAKQEFSDCLQTIRAEQQKKQESAAELDDQTFRDLFRHHS